VPDKTHWKSLTLQKVTADNQIFLDNAASGNSPQNLMAFVDVDFDLNGQVFAGYGAWIYRSGRCWTLNCTIDVPRALDPFSTSAKQVNHIGSSGDLGSVSYNIAASKDLDFAYVNSGLSAANRETSLAQFFGLSFLGNGNAAAAVINYGLAIGEGGFAMAGSALEKHPTQAFARRSG